MDFDFKVSAKKGAQILPNSQMLNHKHPINLHTFVNECGAGICDEYVCACSQ